ncbi:MAG: TIGR03960 family B12-binding radical SAM protein [bacterium]
MIIEGNPPPKKNIQNKINEILLQEVNRPSRYIGQEIGSLNKDWDSVTIRAVIAFPDMYEVGISNLGHRILYHIINANDFLADRVYAPSPDFRQKLNENNIPLYGVESFKPLNEFDVIAFTLQYELSYPTILAMLEMGQIPVKNAERQENDPIIIAGGPGSYNPEPLVDFIDAFIVGDGEEVIIELLEEIKNSRLNNDSREIILKKLAKIEGIYVPTFYKVDKEFSKPYTVNPEFPEKINKRISDLKDKNYPVNFPVPYLSSIHDRAVIEIRRGCGRMCRFCQSCFVNLPIRERDPESIIKITDEILKNTGYDEYSLLALSSNDYGNIENLVCALNEKYAPSGASISLPSQRADAFSLELAKQVQCVRKSTLTFAPEAGSQRLRDVINKNLNEEHIFHAVLSSYMAGWHSIKLYFMIGLPTETFEDIEEIAKLLEKIKFETKAVMDHRDFLERIGEIGKDDVKKPLDVTCSISIFVPKPFTPFQWCAQDSLDLIENKKKFLREKTKHLKGIKLNFHNGFLSQLEAVFARGDRKLNKLVELLYQKGSYLDAWSEHFNKNIWYEAASELNIDFCEYSSRKINLDSELPWDIINTGISKEWLKNEFNKAVNAQLSVPCDEACSSCGLCETFNKTPLIKSKIPVKLSSEEQKNLNPAPPGITGGQVQKYRIKIQKTGHLKYISHLDWQRMFYRVVRKADIKINFTKGFNPSPKISIGMALPLFVESISEYVDIEVKEKIEEKDLLERLNKFLPENSRVLKIINIAKNEPAINEIVKWAKYSAVPLASLENIDLKQAINNLLEKDNVFLKKQKYNKSSKKVVDIRPYIIRPYINSIEIKENNNFYTKLEFILKTGQDGTLRPDEFLRFLTPDVKWNITREELFDCNFKELF